MREEILLDKKKLEDEMAAFENRKEFLSDLSPYIVGFIGVLLLGLIWSSWRSNQEKKLEAERMFSAEFFLPKEVMSTPATMLYMQSVPENAYLVTGALLDLVRKGYVKHEEENTFTVIHRDTDYEHEAFLLEWMFEKIGSNHTFQINDLEAYTEEKTNHKTFHEDMKTWAGMVAKEVKMHDLVEKKTKFKWTVGLMGLLLIPFAVLIAIHELYMWTLIIIALFFGLEMFILFYSPKTAKGIAIREKWKEFENQYPQINENQWRQWPEDDQMRSIIYAIGLNDKKMNEKNKRIIEKIPAKYSTPALDMMSFLLISTSIQESFSHAEHTVAASTGSVNAGTGTGVGGGGGGSGAF
ncbi:DUF2207 family protein [Salinibacillus kushneri]